MSLGFLNKRANLKEVIDNINSNLIVIGTKYDYSYFTPALEEAEPMHKVKNVKFKLKLNKTRTVKAICK